ncbi:LOG family protein [Marinobacter koreensis]|uniref:AMP nucleosidase n=1 Tax=Marinobacter koreensis TaxID=335974 RepID=A0ABW0RMZ4_9GAMM|nr:LOG family protein [Marinobacter koreensis]MCK7549215.1 LOG family protein [Marinobacter koreensis]MDX1817081.1 LOG family protein [Marinobacter sp.]
MTEKKSTTAVPGIPTPPHPHFRRQPLPECQPKAASEDLSAPERIRILTESPGYRQADQDIDYLNLDETRGVRLQIDYQKPEFLLEQHNISHTIVVFGSTRITEPATARQRVRALKEELAASPDDPELVRHLRVAERILAKSHYYEVARAFGQRVGKAGKTLGDGELVIMTGGGPGIMEAANRGAFDVQGKSIGLNITLPHEQYPNPYITPNLCFRFHYFALRKLHFLLRTRALVVFPGGYGTLDELFETLTLAQTRKIQPIPVILVGEQYWRRVFDVDFLVDEGVIDEEDRDLFWYAETADDIWNGIIQWHQSNGSDLFAD